MGGRFFFPSSGLIMVSGVGSTDLKLRASPLRARKASDKATNGSVRASISLLFDLAIQELSYEG